MCHNNATGTRHAPRVYGWIALNVLKASGAAPCAAPKRHTMPDVPRSYSMPRRRTGSPPCVLVVFVPSPDGNATGRRDTCAHHQGPRTGPAKATSKIFFARLTLWVLAY